MQYALHHYETQRNIAQKQLEIAEHQLWTLEQRVPEDVRENHRRTINNRIQHYTNRVNALNQTICEMSLG